MRKQRFVCKNCGRKFVVEIVEPGEAEEKNLGISPVRCPHCGSDKIERI